MDVVYLFDGIDCANCAMKLEGKFKKVKGVKSANINFLAKKVNLTVEDESSLNEVIDIASHFEDGVKLRRVK